MGALPSSFDCFPRLRPTLLEGGDSHLGIWTIQGQFSEHLVRESKVNSITWAPCFNTDNGNAAARGSRQEFMQQTQLLRHKFAAHGGEATTGHAAAPPRTMMNSRRLI
jgi:hypothetical protein